MLSKSLAPRMEQVSALTLSFKQGAPAPPLGHFCHKQLWIPIARSPPPHNRAFTMKRILFAILAISAIAPNVSLAGKATAIVEIVKAGEEAVIKTATGGEKAAVKGEAKVVGKAAGKEGGKEAGKQGGLLDYLSKNGAKATGRWIGSNKETKDAKRCPDCGGDGKSYFRTCKTCNGSGYIRWIAE